ncbi:MAG TPA: hypothetical protein VGG72_11970 [Bryobacteraceae bacterium]|jgi:hypothetical protein
MVLNRDFSTLSLSAAFKGVRTGEQRIDIHAAAHRMVEWLGWLSGFA